MLDIDVKHICNINAGFPFTSGLKWVWKDWLYILCGGVYYNQDAILENSTSSESFLRVNLITGKYEILNRPNTDFLRQLYSIDFTGAFIRKNEIYMLGGGYYSSSNYVNDANYYVYNMECNTWYKGTLANLLGVSNIKGRTSCALIGNELYFTKAADANSFSPTFRKINLDTGVLTTLAAAPINLTYSTLRVIDKKIYAFLASTTSTFKMLIYSPDEDSWKGIPPLGGKQCGWIYINSIEQDKKLYLCAPNYQASLPLSTEVRKFAVHDLVTNEVSFEKFSNDIPNGVAYIYNGTNGNPDLLNYNGRFICIGQGTYGIESKDNTILSIGNKSFRTGVLNTSEMILPINIEDQSIIGIKAYGHTVEKTKLKILFSIDNGINYYAYDGNNWNIVNKDKILNDGMIIEDINKLNKYDLEKLITPGKHELKVYVGMITYDPFSTPILESIEVVKLNG